MFHFQRILTNLCRNFEEEIVLSLEGVLRLLIILISNLMLVILTMNHLANQ